MKKIISITFILLLASCDKYVYYDFFVRNNCDFPAEIIIVNARNLRTTFTVESKQEMQVYESKGFNVLSDRTIESVFSSIIAIHGQDTTVVNYIDKDQWEYQVIDNEHANCYLEIDSIDFKQTISMD